MSSSQPVRDINEKLFEIRTEMNGKKKRVRFKGQVLGFSNIANKTR